jgi:hypothetical protein
MSPRRNTRSESLNPMMPNHGLADSGAPNPPVTACKTSAASGLVSSKSHTVLTSGAGVAGSRITAVPERMSPSHPPGT